MKKLLLLFFPALLLAQNPTTGSAIFQQSIFATVASSTTDYITFSATGFNTTENTRQFAMPIACTMSNFTILTTGTQSSTGSLVITVRKNGAATTLTSTIAASAAPGTISVSASQAFAKGDLVGIQLVNNATAASLTVVAVSASCR